MVQKTQPTTSNVLPAVPVSERRAPRRASPRLSLWSSIDRNLRLIMVIGLIEAAAVNAYTAVLMPDYKSMGFDSKIAGSLNSVQTAVAAVLGFQ